MFFSFETNLAMVFMAIVHIAIFLWYRKKFLRSIIHRHVVITGGSSGIGFWIAVNCVKLGAHVTIIARKTQKLESALEEIEKHRVDGKQLIQFRSIDLSTSYDVVKNALNALEEEIAPIYMLINCAGGTICGRVDEVSPEDAVYLMNTNYYTVYYPTRYVLTQLRKTGEGLITIIGSQASLMGVYGYGPYSAAKFALRGLAETIALEVSNTKISVTLALPADIDTPKMENETKSEMSTAELEKMAEKILYDSLKHKSISTTNMEIRYLIIVWKIATSIRPLFVAIRKKYNFIRALIPRTQNTASKSLNEKMAAITDLPDNKGSQIENDGAKDLLGNEETIDAKEANMQPVSDKSDFNVTTTTASEPNSSTVFKEQPFVFSASSTDTKTTTETSSTGNIPSGELISVLEGSSSELKDLLSIWSKDYKKPVTNTFTFDAFKSMDTAASKNEIDSTVTNTQISAAPVTSSLSNPEIKTSTMPTSEIFSFDAKKSSTAGGFKIGSTFDLASKSSETSQAKPAFSFGNASGMDVFGKSKELGSFGKSNDLGASASPILGDNTVNSTTPNSFKFETNLSNFENLCSKAISKNDSTSKSASTNMSQSAKIGTGTSFSFNANGNTVDSSKPFNFEAPAANDLTNGLASTSATDQNAHNRRSMRIPIRRKV